MALIGAGAMGGAIGTRLCEVGHDLAVFDLDPARVAELVAKGARRCGQCGRGGGTGGLRDHLAQFGAGSSSGRCSGPAASAEGARPGTLVIDMSSIDPAATRALAARAQEAGLRWVDSPLSGGAPKALIGQLTLMAGGDAQDVADATRCCCATLPPTSPIWARRGRGRRPRSSTRCCAGSSFSASPRRRPWPRMPASMPRRSPRHSAAAAPTARSCRNTCRASWRATTAAPGGSTTW